LQLKTSEQKPFDIPYNGHNEINEQTVNMPYANSHQHQFNCTKRILLTIVLTVDDDDDELGIETHQSRNAEKKSRN